MRECLSIAIRRYGRVFMPVNLIKSNWPVIALALAGFFAGSFSSVILSGMHRGFRFVRMTDERSTAIMQLEKSFAKLGILIYSSKLFGIAP